MGKIGKRLRISLESKEGFLTALILALASFIFIYYFYLGFTTTPEFIRDSDSLDYHIPIAKSIFEHGFFNPPDLQFGLGYYPGVGEAILSLFMRVGLPLNLFNFLAIVLLFCLCFKLGELWGLNKYESLVFSFSITTLNSVLRLVLNQTIDIWLAVFFTGALYLFRKKETGFYHYFFLGTMIGLLIGVKYSGILFAFILCLFFWKKLPKLSDLRKLIAFLVPVFIFGLSWYLRNYFLTGNPIFPGKLFSLPLHPDFKLQQWSTLKTIFLYKNGVWLFIQASISEYLIWTLSFLFLPLVIIFSFRNTKLVDSGIKLLALLAFANFLIYLSLPSWPGNIISDLRYGLVAAIPGVLGIFLFSKKLGKMNELFLISILGAVSVIAQFAFRPKLIFIWLILVLVIVEVRLYKANKL